MQSKLTLRHSPYAKVEGFIVRNKVVLVIIAITLFLGSTSTLAWKSWHGAPKTGGSSKVDKSVSQVDDLAYNHPYPASQKLRTNQPYLSNGIQIEFVSNQGDYNDPALQQTCDASVPKTTVCLDYSHGAVVGYVFPGGCPVNDKCVTTTSTHLLTLKVTNISGENLDYTSCLEQGVNCSSTELANQTKVINSLDIGCVAQMSAYKTYQTIDDSRNVYTDGGFWNDPTYPAFDVTQISYQTTLGAAITTFTNTGTGSYSLQPISIKLNVGETKTAQLEVDHQCVAIGAPDGSAFWALRSN